MASKKEIVALMDCLLEAEDNNARLEAVIVIVTDDPNSDEVIDYASTYNHRALDKAVLEQAVKLADAGM